MIKDCQVGIKVIVCIEDRCLLLQSGVGENAYWDVPGGRIDGDETIEQTLHRELHEELPTIQKFSVTDIVGAYRLEKDLEGDKGLVLVFYRIEAETFDVTLSSEHVDFKWVTKANITELRNPGISINSKLYTLIEKVITKS